MTVSAHRLTPDELIILSREIQAIIVAGVPLDFGLQAAAAGFPSRLETVSLALSERLKRGQSLDDALRAEESIPVVYRAILVAGVRSGRAAEVLAEISELTGHLSRIRQSMYLGLVYPGIVCVVSLFLLAVVLRSFLPNAISLYESLNIEVPGMLTQWQNLPAIPVAIAFLILIAMLIGVGLRSGGKDAIVSGLSAIPGAGPMLRDVRLARTTSILGLLVQYEVPLPEALRLTADTTVNPEWQRQLRRLAETTEAGEPISAAINRERGFPPFLRWLIAAGAEHSNLGEALRQAAEHYRERAYARGELLSRVVPAVVLVLVGGGVTLTYALAVFGPMALIWQTLGTP